MQVRAVKKLRPTIFLMQCWFIALNKEKLHIGEIISPINESSAC